MPSSHFILCGPLLLLPPIPPSIRVFSNESSFHMRWLKYWSFSFSISPSNEHPGLISFRMDSLDLFEVQGTLKSLLQHHSSKASVLRRKAFFTVQLSHPYMTTCTKLLLLLLLLSRFSRVRLHATPRWQTTRLTPSLGFSRQEHWSGFPLPSPGTKFSSVQFSSVAQSCLTLCDPMNHSTPGLPVHHQPLEFTQTHVH